MLKNEGKKNAPLLLEYTSCYCPEVSKINREWMGTAAIQCGIFKS